MVTITRHDSDSPSAQATAKALKSFEVTDSVGRKIALKKPGILAQYHLIDVLGESASNNTYVSMVLPLIYVSAIDGDPTESLDTRLQIDALLQRLDEHGMSAVMEGLNEHFGNKPDPSADKAALKK